MQKKVVKEKQRIKKHKKLNMNALKSSQKAEIVRVN